MFRETINLGVFESLRGWPELRPRLLSLRKRLNKDFIGGGTLHQHVAPRVPYKVRCLFLFQSKVDGGHRRVKPSLERLCNSFICNKLFLREYRHWWLRELLRGQNLTTCELTKATLSEAKTYFGDFIF